MNVFKHKEVKLVFQMAIIATLTILLLGGLCIRLILDNISLHKEIKQLKNDVEIQHNNYTECVSNSIENKWLLEQYQYMFELGYAISLDDLNNSDYCDNH